MSWREASLGLKRLPKKPERKKMTEEARRTPCGTTSWWRREESVWAPRRQTPVSSSPSTWVGGEGEPWEEDPRT